MERFWNLEDVLWSPVCYSHAQSVKLSLLLPRLVQPAWHGEK